MTPRVTHTKKMVEKPMMSRWVDDLQMVGFPHLWYQDIFPRWYNGT